MNSLLAACPVCQGDFIVERLHCQNCDTVVEGSFELTHNPLLRLSAEQTQFAINFIRHEGRFNRLEEELSLSYPTLKSRLNEVIRALGFEPGKEEVFQKPDPEERRKILESLEKGKIDLQEAQRRLSGLPEEKPEPEN